MHMLHFRRFAICLHNSQYHFNLTETKKKDSFTHDFFIWCQSPLLRDSYKAVTLHSHILPVMVTKLSHSIHTMCQSWLQNCCTPFTHCASPWYNIATLHSHTLPVLVTRLLHSTHTLCQSLLQSCHTPFTHSASPCYKAVTLHSHTLPVLVTKLSHFIHTLCQSLLQSCHTLFTYSASPRYNAATLHSHTLPVLVTKSLLQSCFSKHTLPVLVTKSLLQHCNTPFRHSVSPRYKVLVTELWRFIHTLSKHTLCQSLQPSIFTVHTGSGDGILPLGPLTSW